MKASRKDEPKGSERRSWASWLKEEGIGLDRLNDQCKDREFRTARSSDLNFVQGREGRVYPISTKTRRKPACLLQQDR